MRWSLRPRHTNGNWSATWIIMAVTIFWFLVVQTIFGHTTEGYLHSGALAGTLVSHGQWFRLFSSIFVHINIMHILVNMISLWTLAIVESAMGRDFFVVAYVLGGVIGNILSFAFSSDYVISAGASGAIFSLFGCMLGLAYLRVLPIVVRNQLLFILIINIVLDITHSGIDWLAHLGGLGVGFLLTVWYRKVKKRPFLLRMAGVLLVVLSALSLIFTVCTPIYGVS